jgi:hypothetical protein
MIVEALSQKEFARLFPSIYGASFPLLRYQGKDCLYGFATGSRYEVGQLKSWTDEWNGNLGHESGMTLYIGHLSPKFTITPVPSHQTRYASPTTEERYEDSGKTLWDDFKDGPIPNFIVAVSYATDALGTSGQFVTVYLVTEPTQGELLEHYPCVTAERQPPIEAEAQGEGYPSGRKRK